MRAEPSFTIGVEEEYHLVRTSSGDLVTQQPDELLAQCQARFGERVTREFQQCQLEIATEVCRDMQEVRADLLAKRAGINAVAQQFGIGPIAASTHPYGQWHQQIHTPKPRYDMLAEDMQIAARRLLICGMHVHVGIEPEELRIDLLNQAAYFLPHLLALSTSSPFWQGELTGLKAYRLSVFDEVPRTGIPEQFASWGEYRRVVSLLAGIGVIPDATMIWWDLRPSDRYPTLEMRICDVCTRVDDAVAIAALFRCILRMLYRLCSRNQRWRAYPNFLIRENRWRAQRYGVAGQLIDFGRGELRPFVELMDELAELVGEDAAFFGCESEIAHCRGIARDGTSADRQIARYRQLRDEGASTEDALCGVVRQLMAETLVS